MTAFKVTYIQSVFHNCLHLCETQEQTQWRNGSTHFLGGLSQSLMEPELCVHLGIQMVLQSSFPCNTFWKVLQEIIIRNLYRWEEVTRGERCQLICIPDYWYTDPLMSRMDRYQLNSPLTRTCFSRGLSYSHSFNNHFLCWWPSSASPTRSLFSFSEPYSQLYTSHFNLISH